MALKVFLVEDESVVREGLRDNIPWEQFGYQFVGEASDGEMALPFIRKCRPDVLITDIKMPFMDGLSLSHIARQEFPEMKIIIISGYDDFEYARSAIKEGVDQYLLKPITRRMLQKALTEVKEKIESEQEQKNYLKKFQDDMHEYEQFVLRNFFEKLFEGQLSVQEIYEEAKKHALDVSAPCYNLVLINVQEKYDKKKAGETCQQCYEELMRYLLRFAAHYLVFRWNVNTYGVMIKGETGNIDEWTGRCLENIRQICTPYEEELDWYAAAGTPVERFSMLSDCYRELNHIFSYRFFVPSHHILSEELVDQNAVADADADKSLEDIDIAKINPELFKNFLAGGEKEEIEEFVRNFISGISDVLKSRLFWDYLLLNARFVTLAFVEQLGVERKAFLEEAGIDFANQMEMNSDNMQQYIEKLLKCAIAFRDREYNTLNRKALQKALSYIEENYMQENLSLNETAAIMEVTPNYFSAMFSQEMKMTFVEYVTDKRMEKAKKLLQETELRSSEIASAVGYKNPQYFSFVFKRTQGCTPREYREQKEG